MDGNLIEVDFKTRKVKKSDPSKTSEKPVQTTVTGKFEYFQELIKDNRVLTFFLVNYPGVVFPEAEGETSAVAWSYKFGLKDFAYDKKGVSGTLSFNGVEHFVLLPWGSIFLMGVEGKESTVREWRLDAVGLTVLNEGLTGEEDSLAAQDPLSFLDQETEEDEESAPVMGSSLRVRIRKAVLRGLKEILGTLS